MLQGAGGAMSIGWGNGYVTVQSGWSAAPEDDATGFFEALAWRRYAGQVRQKRMCGAEGLGYQGPQV
jgi:hypothetical protein